MRRRTSAILILVALISLTSVVRAQDRQRDTFDLMLRGVPLANALETLVRLTQIDLVYNSNLVTPVEVFCVRRNATAESLLRCVLEGTDLEYVRSLSGAYVLIPAVRRPAATGSLAGMVVDAETGAPLPYANVFLAEASTGTAANDAGMFTLAPLISGPYRMSVTYVGYETATDTVFILPGRNHRVQIPLHSSGVTLSPVVVDGLEQRLPSQGLGEETLDAAELARAASVGPLDVARAAATLTGVSVQRPLADLHIQGGSAGSHVVLLDGAPVREPVSLGRHLSAFSPLALGRMSVDRAGFPVHAGSNLTGRLSLKHDLSVSAPAELKLSVDPTSLNGRIATRFGQRAPLQGSAMLAIRTSMWDLYREPYIDELFRTWHAADPLLTSGWIDEPVSPTSLHVLKQAPDVRFSDVHAAVRLRPSTFQTFEASIYHARNQLASTLTALNDPGEGGPGILMATDDLYDWVNWAAQGQYHWVLGSRTLVSTHVRGSWHDSEYTYGTGLAAAPESEEALDEAAAELLEGARDHLISDESNRIVETSIGVDVHHSLTRRSGLSGGVDWSGVSSRFRLGSPFIPSFAYDIQTWNLSGFLAADLYAGTGTVLEPGLRATYVPARNVTYLEPRLSIRHDRAESAVGGLAVRVSGGIYRQFVNEFELTSAGATAVIPFIFFWLPVGESVAPPRAYHLAGDAMVMPSSRLTLNLSLYYKWQPRLLVLDYARLVSDRGGYTDLLWLQQDGFVAEASGRAYGGDVRFRYKADRWSFGAGYALSIADRAIPNRFEGKSRPVPWNVPHELHAGMAATVVPDLTFELDTRVSAGRTWVYRGAYYDYLLERIGASALEPLRLADPESDVLPAAVTVDAGVTYELGLGLATAQLRVFLMNALDRDNIYERNAFGEPGSMVPFDRSLPGRRLLVSLTLSH